MLELLSRGVFASFFFSLLEAQSYDAASHSSLRQRFGLYPMADGARIRCAIGAVLPRPECVQPRAKRSPREIKQLYAAPFSAANPLLKLLPLVVVLSNSLTSFHVVAKTVLDSL